MDWDGGRGSSRTRGCWKMVFMEQGMKRADLHGPKSKTEKRKKTRAPDQYSSVSALVQEVRRA